MLTHHSKPPGNSACSPTEDQHSQVQASDHPVDTTLQEIERLLSLADASPDDTAFPLLPGLNRRNDKRHPFLAEVLAVLTEADDSPASTSVFRTIRGWTTDLSPRSVGFVLPEELHVESLLLLINHPDYSYPRCCFSARIFRHSQSTDGDWEYGAVLRPMFDSDSVIPGLFKSTTRLNH